MGEGDEDELMRNHNDMTIEVTYDRKSQWCEHLWRGARTGFFALAPERRETATARRSETGRDPGPLGAERSGSGTGRRAVRHRRD